MNWVTGFDHVQELMNQADAANYWNRTHEHSDASDVRVGVAEIIAEIWALVPAAIVVVVMTENDTLGYSALELADLTFGFGDLGLAKDYAHQLLGFRDEVEKIFWYKWRSENDYAVGLETEVRYVGVI